MAKMETKFTDLLRMDYEVLVEHSKAVHKALRTKAYGEGYAQGKLDAEMDEQFGHNTFKVEANTTLEIRLWKPDKTPQEQRDEIVERAKADIDDLRTMTFSGQNVYFVEHYGCSEHFIVDKEKRTIVVLLKGVSSKTIYSKGVAKCAPNDCFNVHIGKAIALRRALGLDVPNEYLNAPQPTEVRVGDYVEYTGKVCEAIPEYGDIGDGVPYRYCWVTSAFAMQGKIVDDSREGGTE